MAIDDESGLVPQNKNIQPVTDHEDQRSAELSLDQAKKILQAVVDTSEQTINENTDLSKLGGYDSSEVQAAVSLVVDAMLPETQRQQENKKAKARGTWTWGIDGDRKHLIAGRDNRDFQVAKFVPLSQEEEYDMWYELGLYRHYPEADPDSGGSIVNSVGLNLQRGSSKKGDQTPYRSYQMSGSEYRFNMPLSAEYAATRASRKESGLRDMRPGHESKRVETERLRETDAVLSGSAYEVGPDRPDLSGLPIGATGAEDVRDGWKGARWLCANLLNWEKPEIILLEDIDRFSSKPQIVLSEAANRLTGESNKQYKIMIKRVEIGDPTQRDRLYYGVPSPKIDSFTQDHDVSNFAITLHRELSGEIPDLPRQMVVVGDNWQQACATHEGTPTPISELERMMQTRTSGRGTAWAIKERGQSAGFQEIFESLEAAIPNLDDRQNFFNSLTVVDATSLNPLDIADIPDAEKFPWGARGHFKATDVVLVRADHGLPVKILRRPNT